MSADRTDTLQDAIAIVGMSGRFPRAESVERFWENLCQGVECISAFTPEELEEHGVSAEEYRRKEYVPARGVLGDIASFDAVLFGYTPREAELIDPQQRLFLECAWEAMERAGHCGGKFPGSIGCFGGVGMNTYLLNNVGPNRRVVEAVGVYQTMISNDKDYVATRTAYKLGLTGPAVTIQTACSTSLVAVHHACQALLSYQCDMALAGGAAVWCPHKAGYQYYQGGILSPDGHCRAFDAEAAGTVVGTGVGVVALRRYEEAVRDGDTIVAVILGSAVNNDGAEKIGFTAPSVNGQGKAIAEALSVAGVGSGTIGYVEAHGTGTPLGDPIELAALNKVFGDGPFTPGSCAIGSVKANIGHADAAAGVASLIKTALVVRNGLIPPSINYGSPNPKIDFGGGPFFVNTSCRPWASNGVPRRAGVSSFGIGGTNAHVVLQEPPARRASGPGRERQILCLSAKTEPALDAAQARLGDFLERVPATPLADVAFTLHHGRTELEHRAALVCADGADAVAALRAGPPRVLRSVVGRDRPSVVFLCTGQGAQLAGMGRRLHEREAAFRTAFDECARASQRFLGADLREIVFSEVEGGGRIDRTELAQPALFAVEYAVAQLWRSWGVQPESLLGHSIGEYVAACLAGVMPLEQACEMVTLRGRVMQSAPPGAMTAVKAPAAAAGACAVEGVSLAVDNGPEATVYGGSFEAIERFEAQLAGSGIGFRRLRTSHAFHSPLMDPVLDEFDRAISKCRFEKPAIPYLSNVTGTWITAEQAVDPAYYVNHLRSTVRFGPSLDVLLQNPNLLLCEIGPGRVLGSLAVKHPKKGAGHRIVASLTSPEEPVTEDVGILQALGKVWTSGIDVDWTAFYRGQTRNRVELPTYPFERKRFWIEARGVPGIETSTPAAPAADGGDARVASSTAGSAFTAGDDSLEQTRRAIGAIWREILGVGEVGPHDSLFDLGGQSLQAVQIATRISQQFSVDLTVGKLLELPTISLLADHVAGNRSSAAPAPAAAEPIAAPQRPAVDLAAVLEAHPYVAIERRPLLHLVATGKVPRVDAAAFDYIPLQLMRFSGLSREAFIELWCNNLPVLQGIWEVPLGRIAYIVVPRLSADLYRDPQDAVRVVVEGLELAASIGAKAVSLTGIIPSATDYGRAVAAAIQGRTDLPLVTTGHGTTTAAVVLSIKGILERARRDPCQERMAFVGLGSIGQATLRLLMRALPHPRELILCDLYSKRGDLERLRDEVIRSGYQGQVTIAEARASLPDEVYGASFIFGATNVADILDIGKVARGTLIVDDSAPHCYDPEKAIERFERDRDILFTEGGMLSSNHPVRDLSWIPGFAAGRLTPEQLALFLRRDAHEFWGCMFSSLLTARFEDLEPTFGMVAPEITKLHLDRLETLGIRAARLHCDRYELPERYVDEFVETHAHAQRALS
jgi:acyl transferase domain-containing protein